MEYTFKRGPDVRYTDDVIKFFRQGVRLTLMP